MNMLENPPVPQFGRGPDEAEIDRVLAPYLGVAGNLLPMLHAVQDAWGYVPVQAHGALARAAGVTKAELHGVLTFYHDFRAQPAGQKVLKICRAEACQAMGGGAVEQNLKAALGLDWGQTSADGRITLQAVYCLGLCACAPAALLDEQPLGRVDAPRLLALLSDQGAK